MDFREVPQTQNDAEERLCAAYKTLRALGVDVPTIRGQLRLAEAELDGVAGIAPEDTSLDRLSLSQRHALLAQAGALIERVMGQYPGDDDPDKAGSIRHRRLNVALHNLRDADEALDEIRIRAGDAIMRYDENERRFVEDEPPSEDAIVRGARYLGAVAVGENQMAWLFGDRVPYRKRDGYCVAQAAVIGDLALRLDRENDPAVAVATWSMRWQTDIAEMPPWWTPHHQNAWRIKGAGVAKGEQVDEVFYSEAAAQKRLYELDFFHASFEHVTADLNTGQEKPAVAIKSPRAAMRPPF